MKRKQLYIVPGFGEFPTDLPYKKITQFARKQGYTVIPVSIVWDRRTMSHWLEQLREVVKKHGDTNSILLGFSFGAYIALLGSKEFNFEKVFLCSLSPYFKEDLKHIPEDAKKFFGKKRMADFQKYTVPRITIPTTLFFGDQDWPMAIKKARKIAKDNPAASFELIEGIGHDISEEEYLEKIKQHLKNPAD
ncbi:MAG: alpha/beta hydrolase [Candidatus Paceibacterota bacterium]